MKISRATAQRRNVKSFRRAVAPLRENLLCGVDRKQHQAQNSVNRLNKELKGVV